MHYQKIIKIPIYPFDLIMVVSDETDKCNQLIDGDEESFYASTWKVNLKKRKNVWSRAIAVIFNITGNVPSEDISAGIVAHEAVHVKNMVFKGIGHLNSIKWGEDEPEAYLMDWLVDTIWNYVSEIKEIEKRKEDENNKETSQT